MRAKQLGKTLNSRELNTLIHPLRYRDNRNLLYLAADYLTLAAVLTTGIGFCHNRADWGIAWGWNIPVVILTVLLVGAVQHRLAGLAHEGAHYILLKNRFWNEFVSDFFCLFPLFSTTGQYRLIHLGHHEYTNDWDHDPELLNLGKTRMMDKFPMTKWEFIYRFYVRIFWPPALLRYMWDNIFVTTLGNGVHPYAKHVSTNPSGMIGRVRITSVLGVVWFAVYCSVMGYISYYGTAVQMAATMVGFLTAALAVIAALPEDWFFQSDLRPVIPVKVTSALRLTWLLLFEAGFAWAKLLTGTEWGVYVYLFWVLPLFTSFPYYMLLRDLYQHANADDGKLTNSRVIFCNWLTRWAMFIYGQDVHLTHHLYPAVPHYNLHQLHQLLMQNNVEYAENVVECDGMFFNHTGRPTMLDVIEQATCEPGGDAANSDDAPHEAELQTAET
ncbi:MAG TPA: fatty acid desaturase [Pirellulales bacterium]|jgi:fatty acid desaturase|nr:fatty acid desaturase [Pirellulales bacterium]